MDQRQVTAEHEAAHAIAYLVQGLPLYRVEIEPDAITRSTAEPVARDLFTMAVVSMAGPVIEDRYRAQPLSERVAEAVEWVEWGDDPAELGDMELFATHPELAEAAYTAARIILEHNEAAHAEIAAALLEHGALTGAEVAALPLAGQIAQRHGGGGGAA